MTSGAGQSVEPIAKSIFLRAPCGEVVTHDGVKTTHIHVVAIQINCVSRSHFVGDIERIYSEHLDITHSVSSLLFLGGFCGEALAIHDKLIEHKEYIAKYGDMDPVVARGPVAFYEAYSHHAFQEPLPEAYIGSDDPRYGRWLAASVEGLARRVVQFFLEAPERPSLGANGPWFSEEVTRLAIMWDLVGDRLPPDRAAFVRRALIFGAHILDHPDYWNLPHGLASANPNMTSAMALPRGLLGVALRGHPDAERWIRGAEAELSHEISNWISPGGAWIESPGYQAASLDAMLLLATALARSGRVNAFADPKLQETMDYMGFLLTAPDPRFARGLYLPLALIAGVCVGQGLGWVPPRSRRLVLAAAFLVVLLDFGRAVRGLLAGISLRAPPFPRFDSIATTIDGLTFHRTTREAGCWYEPFPCIADAPAIEARGESLQQGFRPVSAPP